jgi:cytochrome c-type biogenesis protein CcmF
MMYFLSVVLIGTVYPIFLDVISSQQISVGPPFYHKLIIPFFNPFPFNDGDRSKFKLDKIRFTK